MERNINKFDGRYCVFFFRIWYMGLCWILRGLKRQQQLTDRRSRWLKEKYLQLYFEDGCIEPMTADAIRAFGGRDWSTTESIGTLSPTSSSALRKRNVKGKKTKSIGNIHALTKVRSIKDLYGNERQKMKKTGELAVYRVNKFTDIYNVSLVFRNKMISLKKFPCKSILRSIDRRESFSRVRE